MEAALKLILTAVLPMLEARRIGRRAGRVATAAFCGLLAGFLFLAAVGCGVAAIWIAALPAYGPAGAPLIAAGALLLLCMVLLLIAFLTTRRRPPQQSAASALDLPIAEALAMFREHKGTLLVVAALAGLVSASGLRNRAKRRD